MSGFHRSIWVTSHEQGLRNAAFNERSNVWAPPPGTVIVGKDGTGPPCYHRRGFPSLGRFMVILLTTIHVIVCLFLAIVVLLQSGKAADLAGAFGGMGSQTVFGPRGSATVLSKATTGAAALFMLTSLTLSIISTRNGKAGPTIFDKTVKTSPVQQKSAPPAAAGGQTQTIPVPAATPAAAPTPAATKK